MFLVSFAETSHEINYKLARDVCREVVSTDSFKKIVDSFDWTQTEIQSEKTPTNVADIKLPLCDFIDDVPVDYYGYQVCELVCDVAQFQLALSLCGDYGKSLTFYLSHGYENDNLFFMFVHDRNKRQMGLLAYAERGVVPLLDQTHLDVAGIESHYLQQRNAYYYNLFKCKVILI
mgnify:CR=1 FL=1